MTTKNETEFATQFKAALTAAGHTQKDFSARYNIPYTTVISWAQGRRTPPEWARLMIIDILYRDKIERGAK